MFSKPAGVAAGLSGLLAMLVLGWWIAFDPTREFGELRPDMDGAPDAATLAAAEGVSIGELGQTFDGVAADLPGSWPRFRGASFDNISSETTRLASHWPEAGPEILWSIELGEGHAGPAVRNGRVYVLDYDEEGQADLLRCFSLADGSEIWQRGYRVKVKRNHGLSRTVPAVDDQYVVTMGPRCHVMCVDATSGDFLWGFDLEKDFGTTSPFWYTGQCPLIDDSVALIAPAGEVLMMGVACSSGEILWQTPNPGGWEMSHTSIMPMTLGGTKMYVYSAIGGMAGIAAEGEERGTVLWSTTEWDHSVLAPSPLVLPDGRIFVTAGYGAGSMMFKVSEHNGTFSVAKLLEYKPNDGLASEQQTAILFDGHLFAIQPKDAGALREQLVCYHPDDCTNLVWSSGKAVRFGLGPYLIADRKLFVLSDDGVLTLAEATTQGFRPIAKAKILDGHDAWGPMAIVGRRLLLRDSGRMVCIDIGA